MTYLLRWMSEEQTYSNEEVEMNSKLQSQEMNWERELKPTVMRISSWTQDFLHVHRSEFAKIAGKTVGRIGRISILG